MSNQIEKLSEKDLKAKCDYFAQATKKAEHISGLIRELKHIIPMLQLEGIETAEVHMEILQEKFDQMHTELFFNKKCPFVNECLNQMHSFILARLSGVNEKFTDGIQKEFKEMYKSEKFEI